MSNIFYSKVKLHETSKLLVLCFLVACTAYNSEQRVSHQSAAEPAHNHNIVSLDAKRLNYAAQAVWTSLMDILCLFTSAKQLKPLAGGYVFIPVRPSVCQRDNSKSPGRIRTKFGERPGDGPGSRGFVVF